MRLLAVGLPLTIVTGFALALFLFTSLPIRQAAILATSEGPA